MENKFDTSVPNKFSKITLRRDLNLHRTILDKLTVETVNIKLKISLALAWLFILTTINTVLILWGIWIWRSSQ